MLLVPQNGFFVLQYAETLYTTSEYSTAYKAFLRVLDMGGLIEKSASGVVAKGPEVRALWGLRAVSRLIDCRCVVLRTDYGVVPLRLNTPLWLCSRLCSDNWQAEGKPKERY